MSWQQGKNNPLMRNMSEEGEIGEEEGEIPTNLSAAAASHPAPINANASASNCHTQHTNPPPPPLVAPASVLPEVRPEGAVVGSVSPQMKNPPVHRAPAPPAGGQQAPLPPPPPPPPHQHQQQQQQPRRGTWGPRPGRSVAPPDFRQGGRGLGNRHSSMTGASSMPQRGNMPQRSQSFTGSFTGRNSGRGPPGGSGPPSIPNNRPTDPRFRGSASSAAFTERRPSDVRAPPGGLGATVMSPQPLSTVGEDPARLGGGGPSTGGPGGRLSRLTSYSSLAEPSGGGDLHRNESPQDGNFGPRNREAFQQRHSTEPLLPAAPPGKIGGEHFRQLSDNNSFDGGSSFRSQDSFRPDSGGPGLPLEGNSNFPPPHRGGLPPNLSHDGPFRGALGVPPNNEHNVPPEYIGSDSGSFGGAPRGNGPPFRSGRRGGRGDGMFRGGRGDGSYYGPPVGGPDSRRSPAGRGRPVFGGRHGGLPPGPGLARQGSWRNSDPRFNKNDGPDSLRSLIEEPGGNGFPATEEGRGRGPPDGKEMDDFGRMRDWNHMGRGSPRASPQGRKPKFGYQERSKSVSSTAGLPSAPTLSLEQRAAAKAPVISAPTAAAAVEKKEPQKKPEPLRTTALGGNKDRAEKAILALADLLSDEKLKASNGDSQLPSKQMITAALAQAEKLIQEKQSSIESKGVEIETAGEVEKEEEQQAKEEAALELQRKEEGRLVREMKRKEEEATQEVNERQRMLEERLPLAEEAKLKAAERLREELLSTKKELEDRFLAEVQREVEVASRTYEANLSVSTMKLSAAVAKLAEIEAGLIALREPDASSTGRAVDIPTDDIVTTILAQNQMRARESHAYSLSSFPDTDQSKNVMESGVGEIQDPKEHLAHKEWARKTDKVTGLADALYTEPCEAPYFEHHEKLHAEIAPVVKEYIRDKQNRLNQHWIRLAEEYEFRQAMYTTQPHGVQASLKGKQNHAVSRVRQTIMGSKPSTPIIEAANSRPSSNPYRRARRGNEVRTEYEQEQVIAALAAKEAMEKRIAFGGCDLPRQIGRVERSLTASYFNTFTSQLVDPVAVEAEFAITNTWTDMEKCIFLDRFMQHPKDFRKIASFLRNKNAKDCVRFYYDSKQTVPYKAALREHIMRRKRRGDFHEWEATIQAAISVGAVVKAGPSEEKPLVFLLPEDDHLYATHKLHPLNRDFLDGMDTDNITPLHGKVTAEDDDTTEGSKKRPSLFVLEHEERKYLRIEEKDDESEGKPTEGGSKNTIDVKASLPLDEHTSDEQADYTPIRKAPQKWTQTEKATFLETLSTHGQDWDKLAQAVKTKTMAQIKNYFYDYKKQSGKSVKPESEKSPSKGRKEKKARAEKPPASFTYGENLAGDSVLTDAAPQENPVEQASLHTASWTQPLAGSDLPMRQALPPDMVDRNMSTTDEMLAAHLWARAQQQQQQQHAALQQQQHHHHPHSQPQHTHSHLQDDLTRRYLEQQSQSQHQQLVNHLLPMFSAQLPAAQPANSMQEWAEVQRLQNLMNMQQQHQHQHQQHPHHSHLAGLGGSPHLQSISAHANVGGGINNQGPASLNRLGFDPASIDENQLAVLQQLAAYGRDSGSGQSGNVETALALLMRSMSGGHNIGHRN